MEKQNWCIKTGLLMPVDIRKAIGLCATKKYEEIKMEMRNIYEYFKKNLKK